MRVIVAAIFLVLSVAACSSYRGYAVHDSVELDRAVSTVELDHVFIFVPVESGEEGVVETLQGIGLIVDDVRNEFPDGILGRYIVFDNAYLELLWLLPGATPDADTRRSAEWQTSGASPYGVGLRRCRDTPDELPFPSRPYITDWMEPGTEMRLLDDEDELFAPSLFVVPRSMAARDSTETAEWRSQSHEEAARMLDHPLGVRLITEVRVITLPDGYPRSTKALNGTVVSIESGQEPLLEITFDHSSQGKSNDLRPILPLVIRY